MKRILSVMLIIVLLFGVALSEESTWTCPNCGRTGLTSRFCGTCGESKPEKPASDSWTCPNCGLEGNVENFCGYCGTKRPSPNTEAGWDCLVCGKTGNTLNFCTKCGTPKEQIEEKHADSLVEGTDYEFDKEGNLLILKIGDAKREQQYVELFVQLINGFIVNNCYNSEWIELTISEEASGRYIGEDEARQLSFDATDEEIAAAVKDILRYNQFPIICGMITNPEKAKQEEAARLAAEEAAREAERLVAAEEAAREADRLAAEEAAKRKEMFKVYATRNCQIHAEADYNSETLGYAAVDESFMAYEAVTGKNGREWYRIDYKNGDAYLALSDSGLSRHTHVSVTEAGKAATCTEPGKSQGSHCSVCGKVLTAQTAIAALGHNAVKDAAVAATCTAGGKTEGKHCSRCGQVLTAQTATGALGHNLTHFDGKNPTKTEAGWYAYDKCSRCGYSTYRARSLKAGNWSSWSTNAVSANSMRDVESKVETEDTFTTKYHYSRYVYNGNQCSAIDRGNGGKWQYTSSYSPAERTFYDPDGMLVYVVNGDNWYNQSTTQEKTGTKNVTYYRYRDYTE